MLEDSCSEAPGKGYPWTRPQLAWEIALHSVDFCYSKQFNEYSVVSTDNNSHMFQEKKNEFTYFYSHIELVHMAFTDF